jgi:hypothetical protein
MEYVLIRGVVRDLTITEGFEDLAAFKYLQSGAATAGIITAALDSPISASVLAGSRNSAVTKMEFFTCSFEKYLLQGAFYKVGFKNGDDMEFVARTNDQIL